MKEKAEATWAYLVYAEPRLFEDDPRDQALTRGKFGSFMSRELAERCMANLAANLPPYDNKKNALIWKVHIKRVPDDPNMYTQFPSTAEKIAEIMVTGKKEE